MLIMALLSDIVFSSGNPGLTIALLTLGILAIGFPGYHVIGSLMMRRMNQTPYFNGYSEYLAHLFRRLLGFLLMGLLPLAVFAIALELAPSDYGINLHHIRKSGIWIAIFVPPIILLNYYVAGKPSNLKQYPQIRLMQWRQMDLLVNFISWSIYLLGYEMLFRGFLLFSLYDAFGAPLAITLNVILYALAHIPKGVREMAGSIPFGVVLCLITLSTGSFLAAFVIHATMALSNEFFAINFHPDMKFKRYRS
jgi:membrane protease YdiL (CAAX protease family)